MMFDEGQALGRSLGWTSVVAPRQASADEDENPLDPGIGESPQPEPLPKRDAEY